MKHPGTTDCKLMKLNSSEEQNLQLPFLSVEKSVFPSKAFLKTFKIKLRRLKYHQLITNSVPSARHAAAFGTGIWNPEPLSQKHLSHVSWGLILSSFFPLCSMMMMIHPSFKLLFWHYYSLKGIFEREIIFTEERADLFFIVLRTYIQKRISF